MLLLCSRTPPMRCPTRRIVERDCGDFFHFYYFWEKSAGRETVSCGGKWVEWLNPLLRVVFFFNFTLIPVRSFTSENTFYTHGLHTVRRILSFFEKNEKESFMLRCGWTGECISSRLAWEVCAFLSYICTARKMEKNIFFPKLFLRIFHN